MTWWGAAIKFSSKEIACLWLTCFFANSRQDGMVERHVMWLRLTTMRYFLSREEEESVSFVKEKFLHKKIQKKRKCFLKFEHKLTERMTVRNSMQTCQSYKVIEKFDKVFSKCLKRTLAWLLPKKFIILIRSQRLASTMHFPYATEQLTPSSMLAFLHIPVSRFGRW